MASAHEQLSEQFYKWEMRGRGWQVFDEPVYPEPPFQPFQGHYFYDAPLIDDGRKPTFLSSLFRKISQKPIPPVIPEAEEGEPAPQSLIREPLVELQTLLPSDLDISREAFGQFLLNLYECQEPVSFELLGTPGRVAMQFVAHPDDTPLVKKQLQAHFPEAMFQTRIDSLASAWNNCEGQDALVVEFGLSREFIFPLATGKHDPFVGIIGALSELKQGELGLFQVLFQPVREPWAESIVNSVSHADGKPFFVDQPELAHAAKSKVGRPLFAAVVRLLIRSGLFERSLEIARDVAGSLRVFANPEGNELIPLENTGYLIEEHIEDALRRQSRRSGMLLNSDELIGFVHLPSSDVRSPVLKRQTGRTKAAPAIVRGNGGIVLGTNVHADELCEVRLTPEQRVQHMHVVGVQGTGKSTFLFNLIRQDIENGEGVGVLDPHGDLIDEILGVIPPERINDVVLVDPSDEHYSIGFNILSAHSDLERRLLASDLVSVFQRLSTSWGDQMASVLKNAILAFLESSQGGTLADLRRFLLEPQFRESFLKTVSDPEIVYYWRKGFAQLSGNKSIGPVITRLNDFLATKPIRYMVSQPVNRLDFGQIIDTGKIFLARLSQGEMGDKDSYLLGSFFVGKIQQLVMARQAQKASVRKDFWLYIDEFHNFITPSMAKILAGARKYRLGLVLAHQELGQLHLDRDVSSALLSNPYTRVYFRVGDSDSRQLENALSYFESKDLQNLERGEAVCRVERSDQDFNLGILPPKRQDGTLCEQTRERVIATSRSMYGTPRSTIEALHHDEEPGSPLLDVKTSPKSPSHEVTPPILKTPQEAPLNKEMRPLPAIMGRGGKQHQYLQHLIKQLAIGFNFEVEVEKDILAGSGSVDVMVKKGEKAFAFEISASTSVEHELENIQKCFKADFQQVIVVCLEETKLGKIRQAVINSLPNEAEKVGFCLPDDLAEKLMEISAKCKATDSVIHGRRTKVEYRKMAPNEAQARRDALAKVTAQSLNNFKKTKS